MTSKQYLEQEATLHTKCSAFHKLSAALHREAAKADDFEGHIRGAVIHRALADADDAMERQHAAMASAKTLHVEQLGAAGPGAEDRWPLAGWTVDANGNPMNTKAAKLASSSEEFRYHRAHLPALKPSTDLAKGLK